MNRLKNSLVLSCGVFASALALAINAGATDFTVAPGTPVYVTRYLDTTGDAGTVEEGGVIDVPNGLGNGITGTTNGVTVNNAGSVASDGASGVYVLGESTVTNSGAVTGGTVGIYASGASNTISNSGTATGDTYIGIFANGDNNQIRNSGVATGALHGIYAFGGNNTIIN
jgi:hypothetical protein